MHIHSEVIKVIQNVFAHIGGNLPGFQGIALIGAFSLYFECFIVFNAYGPHVFGAYFFKVVQALVLYPYSGRYAYYPHDAQDFRDNSVKIYFSASILQDEPSLFLDHIEISHAVEIFPNGP